MHGGWAGYMIGVYAFCVWMGWDGMGWDGVALNWFLEFILLCVLGLTWLHK
jgi:hypothetical protein